jgi:thioredoxin 1
MVIDLTEETFDQAVRSGLVVVDLWAPWCVPCRQVAPIIEALSSEYDGKATFYKINIDEQKAPAVKHQVMGIPTLLIFKDGRLVDRMVGAMPKDKIRVAVERHL